ADAFVDDCSAKGPTSHYGNTCLPDNPGICCFIYEFASTLKLLFAQFKAAGVMPLGLMLILATPKVQIIGSVVSADGQHLDHGLVNNVLKWLYCESVTEVHRFLGMAGIG
ncbi:hypothetical protein FOMPIDRAFT_1099577, partial [Fomitopsis schrenkii]